MNNEKICYLVINGKKVGPLSEQDIKSLYLQKKIDRNTKFARIGDKEWISVSMSDILAPFDDSDGLPPLPSEVKPSVGSAKKPILGFIIASLVVAVAVSVIGNMDNNAPVNGAASNQTTSQPSNSAAPQEDIQSDSLDKDEKQNIAADEEQDSSLWTVENITNVEAEIGDGIYVHGVFDAALWENVNYDLHLSESLEKVAEETFEINIYDIKGFEDLKRIADIGLIEICPIDFSFQGPGSPIEREYPMMITVEGVMSEVKLRGSFETTYVLVSDEELFVKYLYEGRKISIEIPFSRYTYSLVIDGTGFQHAYDEFRVQAGLMPYQIKK